MTGTRHPGIGLDSRAMLSHAVASHVAYVPGTGFYSDGSGTQYMRLSKRRSSCATSAGPHGHLRSPNRLGGWAAACGNRDRIAELVVGGPAEGDGSVYQQGCLLLCIDRKAARRATEGVFDGAV